MVWTPTEITAVLLVTGLCVSAFGLLTGILNRTVGSRLRAYSEGDDA